MTRLEAYRSGDATGVDTAQYITFKNVKLHKYLDNTAIKPDMTAKSQANYIDISEIGITHSMIGY